jgi:zinc D-Ala-D-Ala carboxypeptidase
MKYFTIAEFVRSETADRRAIDNRLPKELLPNVQELVNNVLDPLREAYGKPITVTSGFRCPALNKAVGGSATSQHMSGQAADITAGSREENRRLFYLVQELGLPFDQLIDEKNYSWIHVSYRVGINRNQVLAL